MNDDETVYFAVIFIIVKKKKMKNMKNMTSLSFDFYIVYVNFPLNSVTRVLCSDYLTTANSDPMNKI